MSWWQNILFAFYILIEVLFAGAIVAAAVTGFGQWRIARNRARKEKQISKAREVKDV